MHILGLILIVSGLLVVTYFSGPKNTPQQASSLSTTQSQVENLPAGSPGITTATSRSRSTKVRVQKIATGEIGTIDMSYNYKAAKAVGLTDQEIEAYLNSKGRSLASEGIKTSTSSKPVTRKASDKALKLSAYAFVASNEKQRNDLINKFSNGTNDLKEAIKNIALLLDSNPEAMALIEKTIAQDIANKKSQSDSQAVLEYHEKEYARLKAEYDSIPKNTSYTYTGGTKNNAVTPTKSGSTQVNPYQDNIQDTTNRLKNIVNSNSSGLTYIYGNGTLGIAQKDSNGNIIYGDSKGNFSITTHDSLGNTNTSDGKGRFIDTQTDSLGNKIYSDGKGLFGSSSVDSLGNIYYSDNYGNSILCQTNSLGIKTCY